MLMLGQSRVICKRCFDVQISTIVLRVCFGQWEKLSLFLHEGSYLYTLGYGPWRSWVMYQLLSDMS